MGGGRPVIQVDSTQVDSTRLETAEVDLTRRQSTQLDQVDFTAEELNLLGSKGIVRSPQGEFIKRILEKNGFTSEGMIRRERAQENDHPCEPSCGATSSGDVHANGTVTSRTADTPNLRAPVGT